MANSPANFDRAALRSAVVDLANALAFGAGPSDLAVVEDFVETVERRAADEIDFIVGQGRDPRIAERIIRYIAASLIDGPGRFDAERIDVGKRWFDQTFRTLLELAVPNSLPGRDQEPFYRDLEEGIAVVRDAYDD
jgi:hypothetical protein